jgi:hypothetical protein
MPRKYARLVRQTLLITIAGTSAWFVALVTELAVNAQRSSIYISLVGIGLGLMGSGYIIRAMRRARKRK